MMWNCSGRLRGMFLLVGGTCWVESGGFLGGKGPDLDMVLRGG